MSHETPIEKKKVSKVVHTNSSKWRKLQSNKTRKECNRATEENMIVRRNRFVGLMFMHTNWHRSFKLTQSGLDCVCWISVTSQTESRAYEIGWYAKRRTEDSAHMVYSHVEPIKGTLYIERTYNLSLFGESVYFFLFIGSTKLVRIYCYSWWYGNFWRIFCILCVNIWTFPFLSLYFSRSHLVVFAMVEFLLYICAYSYRQNLSEYHLVRSIYCRIYR